MSAKAIALSLIICSGGILGCATKPTALIQLPTCPPESAYPKISDKELDSLSDKTYSKLVDLISLRDEYINELRVNCDDRDRE